MAFGSLPLTALPLMKSPLVVFWHLLILIKGVVMSLQPKNICVTFLRLTIIAYRNEDFVQATMGYPTKTALRMAVGKGNLSSFPGGLTSAQINRYYYILEPSVKGHLTQERQGIQYTQLPDLSYPAPISPAHASNDAFPARLDSTTNVVFATCFQCTGKIYGDPIGRFIAPSISGNNYILIVYCYDSNTIDPIAMSSRTKEAQIATYNTVITLLKQRGFSPKLATLDNETSD